MPIDEQIVYNQLNGSEQAIWSLLLASGYLKVLSREEYEEGEQSIIEPKNKADVGIIIEFKVFNKRRDKSIEDTLQAALQQIEDKNYEADLTARGVPRENIRKYGFAFLGKEVCIGE